MNTSMEDGLEEQEESTSNGEIKKERKTYEEILRALGVDDRLRVAVKSLGFLYPTLIQEECLPNAIEKGRDLLVRARTGSGKTLAYAIPILNKLLEHPKSKALILAPTKELCHQINTVMIKLIKYSDDVIKIATILNSKEDNKVLQEAKLRDDPNIIIATPASYLKYPIKQKHLIEMVVLDEADLMISYGYASDITDISQKHLPKIYQGFLISATLSNDLGQVILHNPLTIELEESNSNSNLMQYYLPIPKEDKYMILYVFLKLGILKSKGLFFVNNIDQGYKLKLFWEQFHITSAVLNSQLPLQSRLSIVDQFNAGIFDYLIATDESSSEEYGVSRGLDFQHVAFVVNVDFPPTVDSYIHRIGRTARGEERGIALTLLEQETENQFDLLKAIQSTQPQLPLPKGSDTLLPSNEEQLSQPSLLDFDLKDIEGFRYRVEDIKSSVTKRSVRETKVAEIRAEILNSEKLQQFLKTHDQDYRLLVKNGIQHNRKVTHVSQVHQHLKHVPDYMLPLGMEATTVRKKRKRKNKTLLKKQPKKKSDDPLQSYDNVTLDDLIEADDSQASEEEDDDEEEIKEMRKESGDKSKMIMHLGHAGKQKKRGRGASGKKKLKRRKR